MGDQQLRYSAKDHLVQDAMGQLTVAMCEDSATAQQIVDALNAYNAVPQRFLVQDDGTYRDSGSLPPLPDPLPPAECWDVAARQYLSALYSWMLTELTSTQPDPIPVPPWSES